MGHALTNADDGLDNRPPGANVNDLSATTKVNWSATKMKSCKMKSCTVTATNGDTVAIKRRRFTCRFALQFVSASICHARVSFRLLTEAWERCMPRRYLGTIFTLVVLLGFFGWAVWIMMKMWTSVEGAMGTHEWIAMILGIFFWHCHSNALAWYRAAI